MFCLCQTEIYWAPRNNKMIFPEGSSFYPEWLQLSSMKPISFSFFFFFLIFFFKHLVLFLLRATTAALQSPGGGHKWAKLSATSPLAAGSGEAARGLLNKVGVHP